MRMIDFAVWLYLCLVLPYTVNTLSLPGLGDNNNVTTAFPDPSQDPFYKAPFDVDSYQTGQVIRSRKVPTLITSEELKGSYQVLYRTTDTQNQPQATVATVWAPVKPKSPPQVLSYHSFTDSDAFDCSPSWGWIKGSKSKGKESVTAVFLVKWALEHGIYAVNADVEGPNAA